MTEALAALDRAPERAPERYRAVTRTTLDRWPEAQLLSAEDREAVDVVGRVLPFRVNPYVLRELIDWRRVPDDPIFRLVFPQRGMLEPGDYEHVRSLLAAGAPEDELKTEVERLRAALNPHPAGQLTDNVPRLGGRPLAGLQHKYRETVLFFPAAGQTCHAYCTYCFRWPQFVGGSDLRFAARQADELAGYLRAHPEVTDVLVTGGDPMIMKTALLRRYLEPLLASDLEHVQSIRIGTKSLAYWPQRFVSDPDADDCLELFEEIAASGRHLALMAHASHPVELSPAIAREAIRRLRDAGAEIRMQAPVLRHVNDDPEVWAELWREGVKLGMVPYYMFVERDTGARNYFEIPLARCHRIFTRAYRRVSGLGRTVRGPSMSAHPGKVRIAGVTEVAGERVFVLEMLQGRDPDWVGRPFFARFDPDATWLDDLEPAFGEERFFFDDAPPPAARSAEASPALAIVSRP